MRAYVEVRPGQWQYRSGPPKELLQEVCEKQGHRRDPQALRLLARAFNFRRDPEEIWPHPETLLKTAQSDGKVYGDCEDWTRLVCYFSSGRYRPQVVRTGAATFHARPVTDHMGLTLPWDWSGLKQLARKAIKSPYYTWAKRAAAVVEPWSLPLLAAGERWLHR